VKTGWKNVDKVATAHMVYVIMDMGNGNKHKTRVLKDSIGVPVGLPKLYTKAVLQQHPDVETLVDKLYKELSKVSVEDDEELAGISRPSRTVSWTYDEDPG
jgi:hypothetical protein